MEERTDYITEVDEAMQLLRGPVIETGHTDQRIYQASDGKVYRDPGGNWIKLHVSFGDRLLGELDEPQLKTFICIGLHVNEGGDAWPSVETIARRTKFDDRTIRRALRSLEEMGLIGTTPRAGKSNVYSVHSMISFGKTQPIGERQTPVTDATPVTPDRGTPVTGAPLTRTNQQEPFNLLHAKKAREAAEDITEEEAMPADLTYEACDDSGNPIVPRFGQRPKWSIPEENPFLQKLLEATGRKYFKDHEEKALWKSVKGGLVSGLISAAWYEHCLQFAIKQQDKRKPLSLGSLLKYIANHEKMVDWQTGQGQAPTTVLNPDTTVSVAVVLEANPIEWKSPYDND